MSILPKLTDFIIPLFIAKADQPLSLARRYGAGREQQGDACGDGGMLRTGKYLNKKGVTNHPFNIFIIAIKSVLLLRLEKF